MDPEWEEEIDWPGLARGRAWLIEREKSSAWAVERELKAMRQEREARERRENERRYTLLWKRAEDVRRMVDAWVDAGAIVAVRGVSPRDCAELAALVLGERAQYPITVYDRATGEAYRFPEKRPPQSVKGPAKEKRRCA